MFSRCLNAPRMRYRPRKEIESSFRRKEVTIQLNYLTAFREMIVYLMPPYHSKIKNTKFKSYLTPQKLHHIRPEKEKKKSGELGVYENPPFLGQIWEKRNESG